MTKRTERERSELDAFPVFVCFSFFCSKIFYVLKTDMCQCFISFNMNCISAEIALRQE